jgi:hypothetical protein
VWQEQGPKALAKGGFGGRALEKRTHRGAGEGVPIEDGPRRGDLHLLLMIPITRAAHIDTIMMLTTMLPTRLFSRFSRFSRPARLPNLRERSQGRGERLGRVSRIEPQSDHARDPRCLVPFRREMAITPAQKAWVDGEPLMAPVQPASTQAGRARQRLGEGRLL